MMATLFDGTPGRCVAPRRNAVCPGTKAGMPELAAKPSHYARLLRAQSLRGHNG